MEQSNNAAHIERLVEIYKTTKRIEEHLRTIMNDENMLPVSEAFYELGYIQGLTGLVKEEEE